MRRVGVTYFKSIRMIESTPLTSARRWSSAKSSNDPTDLMEIQND